MLWMMSLCFEDHADTNYTTVLRHELKDCSFGHSTNIESLLWAAHLSGYSNDKITTDRLPRGTSISSGWS